MVVTLKIGEKDDETLANPNLSRLTVNEVHSPNLMFLNKGDEVLKPNLSRLTRFLNPNLSRLTRVVTLKLDEFLTLIPQG